MKARTFKLDVRENALSSYSILNLNYYQRSNFQRVKESDIKMQNASYKFLSLSLAFSILLCIIIIILILFEH